MTRCDEREECGNCRFFKLEPNSVSLGRNTEFWDGVCRRYPPSDTIDNTVKKTDWCGEYSKGKQEA